MNFSQIFTIYKKELRDTARDRRTLFSMVLIPIIVMPLIIIGITKFSMMQSEEAAKEKVMLAIEGEDNAPKLVEDINKNDQIEITYPDPEASLEEMVNKKEISAALIIPSDFQNKIDDSVTSPLELVIKSTNSKSTTLTAQLNTVLSVYNSEITQQRFEEAGVNSDILTGAVLETRDTSNKQETSGFILGMIIPLIIVMWSITGGQYTAIDISAGEKERKTLEALLLTPVKRLDIVIGKFLAVSTVALVSTVMAIGSMYFSFTYLLESIANASLGNSGNANSAIEISLNLDAQAVLILLITSVLLVGIFSAFLLSVSIFAKNFKEAGSYISPVYMLIVFPIIMINSMPNFEPQLIHFAIPAINAMLLFKEVLMGNYVTTHIVMTLLSLAITSIIMILLATRIYSKEKVIFGS